MRGSSIYVEIDQNYLQLKGINGKEFAILWPWTNSMFLFLARHWSNGQFIMVPSDQQKIINT